MKIYQENAVLDKLSSSDVKYIRQGLKNPEFYISDVFARERKTCIYDIRVFDNIDQIMNHI